MPKKKVEPHMTEYPGVVTVEKGVLRANTDLYWEYLEDFNSSCKVLLDSKQASVVLDFTRVNFISSSFLGCLTTTLMQASRRGKRIILRITLDISWLFDIMGAQQNVDMEIV